MKTALVQLKILKKGIDTRCLAHVRISHFLQSFLDDCHVISRPEEFESTLNIKIDNIVIVYAGNFGIFKEIDAWVRHHTESKIYWLSNDYVLTPNSIFVKLFKDRGCHVIANSAEEKSKFKHYTEYSQINLNVSAYRENAQTMPWDCRRYESIYYGTPRLDRWAYFREFLPNSVISTSVKNKRKFSVMLPPDTKYIDKLSWNLNQCFLRNFKYSIYLEDKSTHTHFSFLADRFYECLSYDVVMLYHISCLNTIRKSGYAIPQGFIFKNKVELEERKNELNGIYRQSLEAQNQLKATFIEEKNKVINQLKAILN